ALGDVVPVLQVEIGAPREVLHLEGEAAVLPGEHLEDLEARVDDLGADAVTGDAGDLVLAHVETSRRPPQINADKRRQRFLQSKATPFSGTLPDSNGLIGVICVYPRLSAESA